jgi:hypothetical protein
MKSRYLLYTFFSLLSIFLIFTSSFAAKETKGDIVSERSIKDDVADMMDLWILNDRMRDSLEGVSITKDNTLEFRYWKSRTESKVQKKYGDQLKCNAFKWLYFGRTRFSKGIGEIFKKYPEFKGARYIWFDKAIERKYDSEKGTITKNEQVVPYIEIYIAKDKAAKNDWSKASAEMKSIDDCVFNGIEYASSYKFNEKYFN